MRRLVRAQRQRPAASLSAAMLPVSVAVTVLNEQSSLRSLLETLLDQDRLPDEIIIVDGGSTDGTIKVLQEFASQASGNGSSPSSSGPSIRWVSEPGCNISRGRNRAIGEARNEVVAVTDAGVRLPPDWLRLITAPLLTSPTTADVVSGFFVSDPSSLFERALGATVLPSREDVRDDRFLPSSRSLAMRKSVWRQVGGYPEWLDYCEDIVFDLELRDALGARFVFEPRAVAHFRPRSGLSAFFRQYYRYARGDGKANLWPMRHFIRYAAYSYLLLALGSLLRETSSGRRGSSPLLALLALAGATAYLRRPVRRLLDQSGDASLAEILVMLALLPVIRLTGDVAKMCGYPAGWRWRLTEGRNGG